LTYIRRVSRDRERCQAFLNLEIINERGNHTLVGGTGGHDSSMRIIRPRAKCRDGLLFYDPAIPRSISTAYSAP
jgi:hypothetical protein